MFGSLERFTGILIEHFAGHLPLWLSPVQIVVCTITQEADDYAYEIAAAARKLGLNVDIDARNEKITYKVREHSLAKIPVLLVAGKKEAAERTISMRRLGSQQQTQLTLDEALAEARAEGGLEPVEPPPPVFVDALRACVGRDPGFLKAERLATNIAHELGIGFVPVRKKGKLPYTTVSHSYALE